MKTIILDTNTLMAIGQFKLDIFSEIKKICDFSYQLNIVKGTIDELNKIIQEQSGKHKLNAKLALDIIKKKKIKLLPGPNNKETVDDLLVKKAEKGAIIATQDQALKKRIKAVEGKLLVIRQKKKVILI